jgi:hypothetical protein
MHRHDSRLDYYTYHAVDVLPYRPPDRTLALIISSHSFSVATSTFKCIEKPNFVAK